MELIGRFWPEVATEQPIVGKVPAESRTVDHVFVMSRDQSPQVASRWVESRSSVLAAGLTKRFGGCS